MKKILSIALVLFMAFSCIPLAYASDTTIELPALPELSFDEPYPSYYNVYKIVFKVGSDYYASVFEESTGRAGQSMCIIRYVDSSGLRISFGSYGERYVETYKLSSSGTEWVLVYETGSAKVSGDSITEVYLSDYLSHTEDEWLNDWNLRELVVYSDYADDLYISRSQYTTSSHCYLVSEDDYYDITFSCTHIDADGDNLCDLCSESVGGSSEDGGNNSWSDEDKGWLGNLFDDLFSFFNNFYNNLKTKLENIATSITTSIGNFISSATSSISIFINNAVSSISGFIDGVISVINSVSASVGEWIAGVVSEIQAIYTGITDFLVSLWSDMWTAISEFFENLFKDITDYFAEKKAEAEAITEAFTSFFDSIIMLFEAVFDYSYEESGGAVDGNA